MDFLMVVTMKRAFDRAGDVARIAAKLMARNVSAEILVATRRGNPPLLGGVPHVVGVASQKQMVEIETGRNVAMMTDALCAIQPAPDLDLKGDAICLPVFSVDIKTAVPFVVAVPSPQVASGLFDAGIACNSRDDAVGVNHSAPPASETFRPIGEVLRRVAGKLAAQRDKNGGRAGATLDNATAKCPGREESGAPRSRTGDTHGEGLARPNHQREASAGVFGQSMHASGRDVESVAPLPRAAGPLPVKAPQGGPAAPLGW
jgi:hypothetical protein